MSAAGEHAWARALDAATLFAADPQRLRGVHVRASAGPVRDRWLAFLRDRLPAAVPLRRLPLAVDDARLLGGLDLGATLRAGRPVGDRGLLAQCDGGVVVLAMAERLSPATVARLTTVMDEGVVATARDGIEMRSPARFGVVAFDEGLGDDERVPAGLLDRLAFSIDLDGIALRDTQTEWGTPDAALVPVAEVRTGAEQVEALCAAALGLGVDSPRAVLFALHAARCLAALAGRGDTNDEDLARAAALVLAPRATRLPPLPPQEDDTAKDDETTRPPDTDDTRRDDASQRDPQGALEDIVLAAAQAALPVGLLARIAAGNVRSPSRASGRAGSFRRSCLRGRPAGVVRGEPGGGARLAVIATLRAAAPWQRVRSRAGHASGAIARVEVRREDFHVTRYRERAETTTVFVVDASGSSALHRLAEAKGAVEQLLAECYVRRDRVAVVAFRGAGAEIVLPPTRSLVRAKRGLAGLPGGGGTPIASGLDAAALIAEGVLRRGGTPTLVVLTDGRANVGRDGTHGRELAQRDATTAARRLRARGVAAVLIDTSPRAQPLAEQLARDLGARYLALPHADAKRLAQAVASTVADAAPAP